MAVDNEANKTLLAELKYNDLIDRDINPGETVYGLVGIPHFGNAKLDILIDD